MIEGDISKAVYDMQAAVSSLGAFVCFWGFVQFAPCLIRVLKGRVYNARHSECPHHAVVAVLCLAGLIFAFARMNTIGLLVFGSTAAGLAYIAGMLCMGVGVAIAIWFHARWHAEVGHQPLRDPPPTPTLARILGALLIMVMAFLAVGVLRIGS